MEKTNNIINKVESNVIHAYNRYQIALDHADGMYIYDVEGKKYLDFGSGIGVYALGYNNKEYNDHLKSQIDKLIHTSNYFYSEPCAQASEKIVKATGLAKVFFTNSGAEAVEGALKLVKKYGAPKDKTEIIAMEHSFHGRTIGAVSVTGNNHYREPFAPLMPNVKFAEYNDLDSVKALVSEKTCAIIMETVQGEGGIRPASKEFIEGVRAICDANDILLVLDEIQCGMGRSGEMFADQTFGIKPDVVTVAKALGCGVPVGAFVASEKVADVIVAGDHGTTYGGNPMVCAAASKVFDLFESMNILENVKETSKYLWDKLEALKQSNGHIGDHRGLGLMQGIELDIPAKDVILKMLDAGLITYAAGTNVIRFIPPLIVSKENIDEMVEILSACL